MPYLAADDYGLINTYQQRVCKRCGKATKRKIGARDHSKVPAIPK